jgi:hypothetical protein
MVFALLPRAGRNGNTGKVPPERLWNRKEKIPPGFPEGILKKRGGAYKEA